MSRLLVVVFVLAEINLRCVPTSTCGDDDDDDCVEAMDSEREGETETETETEPMPDMGS